MIRTDMFRKKLKVEIDGEPWIMIDVNHIRPGKGQGFVRTKMRNMMSGTVVERTYKSNESLKQAIVDEKEMQFLYQSGDEYTFMDVETYEQANLQKSVIDDGVNYLYENVTCTISFFKSVPISCELPNFVELQVTECEPGVKGNSAANMQKPAILETGYRLSVPLFIEQDSWIRVDTRSGEYVERCKKPEGR
ncbi:MAG: elongation factor P [Acidobacteria bacterium]|nr:MAG: elongation factor P [Acidobacteriota bacterium]PIE90606.1 MAG: elongation factor P [Acidobacteriota bacterium]